jgi:Alpha-galactosidase
MHPTRLALAAGISALLMTPADAGPAAPTPPMGWNSWDAYGLTITEEQFKANVTELAKLKSFGWNYAVIDEGWYMADPFAKDLKTRHYQLDGNGLLLPALSRFPSAAEGAGLKPLGDLVHSAGLKFGVHVIRGIPKDAVAANTPIAGTSYRAADAADTSDICPWDDGNYGIKDNAAGQAYYDSMVKKYADWGVDFIKVDCIADHPYKANEIRQIAKAITNSGREIVLSLSPGPTNITHAAEVGALAQMWRIADDSWDGWTFGDGKWPNGLLTGFAKLAEWHAYAKPGNWPDADMLPFGSLRPNPGWGEPRSSRLTEDEEKSWFTLWAIARSPLILGGNLTELPAFTRSLLTSKEVIAVNQTAFESYPVDSLAQKEAKAWVALSGSRKTPLKTVAVFNTADTPLAFKARWKDLTLSARHGARDLFSGKKLPVSDTLTLTLPARGSAMLRVE